MKVLLIIYAAGQIMSVESPKGMTMAECELQTSFRELEQALTLLDEATNPNPATRQKADAVRDLVFACEVR